MVKLPAPGYPIDGEFCVARNTFLISAALTGKESYEIDMIALDGP